MFTPYPLFFIPPTTSTLEQRWRAAQRWWGFRLLIIPSTIQVSQPSEARTPVTEVVVVLVTAA